MKYGAIELTGLVQALARGPRLAGLTPLHNSRDNESQRTSKIIEALLESLRRQVSPPRR